MTRKEIPGQEPLKDVFLRLIDHQKLPHALLIHGQEGGGSLPLALFLTSYLYCQDRQSDGPCGACSNCKRIASAEHPDVHFIFPVNSNKTVKKPELIHSETFLTEWRQALKQNPFFTTQDWLRAIDLENKQVFIGDKEVSKLREKLALRSYEGGYRVFVIWNAHDMNPTFANKVLKNLEEPSEKTIFILITDHPNQLLSTILSRVQRFSEEPTSDADLTQFLIQKFGFDQAAARNIAFRSEGLISAAIREANNDEEPWLDDFKGWMRMAYQRDMVGLLNWSQKMAKAPRESGRQFINGALKVLDRSFRMGWIHIDIPMQGDEAAFYKNFSPFVNASNIQGLMELLQEAYFHIERNVNERIVWYDTSIKAVRLINEGKKSALKA